MDLRDFVKLDKTGISGKQGLYIVQPSHYDGPPYTEYYRAGAAGLQAQGSQTDLPWNGSVGSFNSRFNMYLNNWIAGGHIHALLTVESRMTLQYGQRARVITEEQDPRDARPKYALKSRSMTQHRERLFHQILDDTTGVSRVLGQRSEWFHARSTETLINALRRVGHGTLILFNSHGEVSRETLTGPSDGVREEPVSNRHSPRIAYVSPRGMRILQEGGEDAAGLIDSIARRTRSHDRS